MWKANQQLEAGRKAEEVGRELGVRKDILVRGGPSMAGWRKTFS